MRVQRPAPAPRAFRRIELRRVEAEGPLPVDVIQWRHGVLRCRACGTRWRARPEP